MAIKSTDRRRASANNNLIGNYRLSGDEQTMLVRDIISEGPIEGLVAGGSSIYVNDDSLMNSTETPVASLGELKVSGTVGSTVLTLTDNGSYYGISSLKPKFIMLKNILFVRGTVTAEGIESRTLGTSVNIKYKYKFTINGPGTFTTAMSTGDFVVRKEGSIPTGVIKDRIGIAEFPGSFSHGMFNTTATTFEFTSSRADLHEHSLFSSIRVSQFYEVASIANNTINLVSPLQYTVENKTFSVPGSKIVRQGAEVVDKKYLNSSFQFSPGTLSQAPHKSFFGDGTSSFQLAGPDIGNELTSDAPQTIQGLSNGVSSAQIASMSKAIITFQYPSGLYRVNKDQGNEYPEFVAYRIELAVQRTSDTSELNNYVKLPGNYSYTASEPSNQTYRKEPIAVGERVFVHLAKTKDAYIVSEVIDLEPYQPFINFRLRITRVTKDGQDSNSETKDFRNLNWKEHPNSTSIHSAKISDVTALVTEKLNYPFTAHATVTFSSKNFSSMPTRTYECKGLRVKIPSIYITREENDGLNAKYTRNPVTGADTNTIQFWDGSFREDKVYTDNPAWVFYDILTNNRYGLGDWMRKEGNAYTDIDIYSLFKIAKYCDELVPDGKGGQEPRMRANFYFTKATDCYKVLKDMATTFHSILYWADGKLMPVMDAPREAVYTFTKGNVIDGMFSYETTGSKTRANQVIVSWVNPENNYKLEPLIVEDRENIVSTGKVIKEEANAFGATSYGQALRFGRWKLWTAINQTEIVSFATSINAAFLAPGDVINVQDAHEHSIAFSGRLVSGTTTQVTLDRQVPITVDANNSYELTVLYTGTFGIVNQVNALIGGVPYYKGDVVPSITTKAQAESTVDDFGDYVDIILSNTSYTATTMVDSVSVNGDSKTVLNFASFPFTSAPTNGTIWALKHFQNNLEVASSYKKYKIVSLSQEEKSKYSIVAVEYFDEKYTAVENDFILELEDPIFPTESTYVDVPTVGDLRISKRANREGAGEQAVISWTAPGPIYSTPNATLYEHLRGYEIEYYDQDERHVVEVSPSANSYTLDLVTVDSSVTVGITCISTKGRRSPQVVKVFELDEATQGEGTRFLSLRVGGVSNTNMSLNTATGVVSFNQQPILAPASVDVPAKTMLANTSQATNILSVGSSGYLLVDYSAIDTGDSLKLVQYEDNTTLRVPYWYDLNEISKWKPAPGTITILEGSSKVVGSGTFFTILFGSGKQKVLKISATKAAIVTIVESDTVLYIDRIFDTTITSSPFEIAFLDLDAKNDFLIGKIKREGASSFSKQSYLTIDTDLEAANIYAIKPIYANASLATSTDPVFDASFSSSGKSHVYFYRYLGAEPTTVVWGSMPDPQSGSFVRVDNSWEFTKIVGNSVTVGTVGTDTNGNTTVELVDENGTKTITVSKGPAGFNSATVFLYKPAALTPSKPTGTLVYTFSTGAVTGAGLDGWSTSPSTPPSGQSLWEIQATAFANTSTDEIAATEFTSPTAVSVSGLSGRSSAVITLYNKGTSSATAPVDPTGDYSYTFSTKTFSANTGADLKGWALTRPNLAEGEYLWAIQGSVVSLEGGDTDTIAASEFSDAAVVGSNIKGPKGDNGTNYTTVLLYQPGATAPTKPTGSFTYTFATGALAAVGTADLKGWSLEPSDPPANSYLWAIQATAFSAAATDTIAETEWSSQFKVSSSGVNGADGYSKGDIVLYNKNTSSTTAPVDPTGTYTYTFSSGSFVGDTGADLKGWTQAIPSLSIGDYLWAIRTTAVANTATASIAATQFGDAVIVGSNIQGTPGLTGFLYYLSGDTTVDSAHITAANPAEGQIAIVQNTNGIQAGYRYSNGSWVSQSIVNTEIIFANAIKSDQLHISNSTGSTSGIYMNGTDSRIDIYDGSTLRVRLGNLATS